MSSLDNIIMPYSFDEALSFLIDNKLTKQQYTVNQCKVRRNRKVT
jgi:hypothetical protein